MTVLGVDPADPDRLLVRMRNPAGDERVLFSDAGGAEGSWRAVLTLNYVDVGIWGEGGAYVGGALDGLWHSPDGETWTQVRESLTPHCLVMNGDGSGRARTPDRRIAIGDGRRRADVRAGAAAKRSASRSSARRGPPRARSARMRCSCWRWSGP
jgi:hypothetical protein